MAPSGLNDVSRGDPASLADLHAKILLSVANALSAVRLFRGAAPFCDPGLALIEEDLTVAFVAAQDVTRLGDELRALLGEPWPLALPEGDRRP